MLARRVTSISPLDFRQQLARSRVRTPPGRRQSSVEGKARRFHSCPLLGALKVSWPVIYRNVL